MMAARSPSSFHLAGDLGSARFNAYNGSILNDLYQTLDPIAFSIGPFSARWYGIAYALGFLLAAVVIYFVGKRWKMRFDFENICVVIICAMVGVIIGGRLGYVLVYNGPFYAAHPLEVLNFANGGMSFHGGLVGALLAGIVAAKIIKMPYLSLLDVAIIGVPIGLFFGRCANFVNGELWGAPTDLPWGVVFGGSAGMMPRHPSQLYEALFERSGAFIIPVRDVVQEAALSARSLHRHLFGGLWHLPLSGRVHSSTRCADRLPAWRLVYDGATSFDSAHCGGGDCAYICLCNEAAARRAVFINE